MNQIVNWVKNPNTPWLGLIASHQDDTKFTPQKQYLLDRGSVVRILRGRKMRTCQSLMDEFSAALQFFEDFGENWDALEECLCYLDEWLIGDIYLVVINNAQEVLVKEDKEQFRILIDLLDDVGRWWSKPITNNGRFNRKAIPFHVLFKCPETAVENVCRRMEEAINSIEKKEIRIWKPDC